MLQPQSQPRGYRVDARLRPQLRSAAEAARSALGCTSGPPDLIRILEHRLPELGVTYHYAERLDMGDAEGLTFPDQHALWIREDVYLALYRGEGHARFTVAHEIGHLWLHPMPVVALARRPQPLSHSLHEDTEWQADTFAAEFLMPAAEVRVSCATAREISVKYNVSPQAAMRRLKELQAEGLMRR